MVVVFLRGLNTYGDDVYRIGPFKFGPSNRHLSKWLQQKNQELIPILNMGVGTIKQMADRAHQELKKLPIWNQTHSFHLLGHSTGGLVARALVQNPEIAKRTDSITTIGSPHHGCYFADIASGYQTMHPMSYRFIRLFGYDLTQRAEQIQHLNSQSTKQFNEGCPDVPSIRYGHIQCRVPMEELSWPLRWAYGHTHNPAKPSFSDGLIESHSQIWGDELARLELDHHAQLGFCFHLQPKLRRKMRDQFQIMIDYLITFWGSSSDSSGSIGKRS